MNPSSLYDEWQPARIAIKSVQERAAATRDLLQRGIAPAQWLPEQALNGPIERTFDAVKDGWTWPEARDHLLALLGKHRAPATHGDDRRTLKSADLAAWKDRRLKSITLKDVRRVPESIFKRRRVPQAHHTLRIVKSALSRLAQRSDNSTAGVR